MVEKKKQYICDNLQLMSEWDFERNNDVSLDPKQLSHGSTKLAYWICSLGHRYSARIDHRTVMGSGCPYCAGNLPVFGENDFATLHPDLLKEWDFENNTREPHTYLPGSNKKVDWICTACGNRWKAKIIDRAIKKTGCPVCMRAQRGRTKTQNTIKRRGSLEIEFPEVATEWDFDKNFPLTLNSVHANSREAVWWKGKCGHSWKATVQKRVAGNGCPICANKTVLAGFNDLASKYPDISREWHPTLNGDLNPSEITAHNERKVWWLCPNCAESYFASAYSRTSLRTGCPVCANKKIVVGKNDLQTTHPSLAAEWNFEKNGSIKPADIVAGSNKQVWWICEKKHEWKASVANRKSGRGCPECAKKKRPISRQKTYLTKNGSLSDNYPEIALQWHPTKNGRLSPNEITAGSSELVWWICEKGHEWEAVVYSRVAGRGCPYCNNEHSTSFPEQALYYYLSQVTKAINRYSLCGKEIDIFLPDLNIGIEYNGRYYHQVREEKDAEKYEYFRNLGVRVIVVREGDLSFVDGDNVYYQYKNSDYFNMKDTVCRVIELCSLSPVDVDIKRDQAKIYEQYMEQEKANSLAVKYPWLIEEWDYKENGKLTPWQVSYGSKKRIHWICKKCGYKWDAVAHTRKKSGCPCCANRVVVEGVNDLCTTHPDLAKEWDYQKNEKAPNEVVAGSHQYAWWLCEKKHSWRAQIKSRATGCGCPNCANKKFE